VYRQCVSRHRPQHSVRCNSGLRETACQAEESTRQEGTSGQPGHAGRTREPLPELDRTLEHILDCCADCHGPLKRSGDKRTRRSEDIPEDLKPVITENILHRDYCPACQKGVEPRLPDVLPRCTLGNPTLVLSAMLHFLHGLTLGQIVDTFNFHLRMKVTPGGQVQMWNRLANLLLSWYEQTHSELLRSA
jgi:transposase